MWRFLALSSAIVVMNSSMGWSQEQATVVFKSGLVVTVDSAYKQLAEAIKRGAKDSVAELSIQGNTFFVRLEEIVVVCKDRCSPMTVVSPARR